MVSQPLRDALLEIKRFILKHQKEVILIQYRKYFPLRSKDSRTLNRYHERLTRELIVEILGDSVRNFSHDSSFRDFWKNNKSVMILEDFDDSWPNTTELADLKAKTLRHLNRRNPDRFHEISLTFTPPANPAFFLKPRIPFEFGKRSNALSILSKPIRETGIEWIRAWSREGKKVNMVSTDFVSLWPFAKSIIDLNKTTL